MSLQNRIDEAKIGNKALRKSLEPLIPLIQDEIGIAGGAYILARQEETNGTGAGTATSGSYQTRNLNTLSVDETGLASLSSGQLTIPAGTYRVQCRATAFAVGQNQIRLQDITQGTTIEFGGASIASVAESDAGWSELDTKFTVSVETVIELQHRVDTTVNTFGFGTAMSFGNKEVYCWIALNKTA